VAQASFTTKLTKELRRSPKKTVVLALIAAVALWFWVPLVWKWVAPQSASAASSTSPTNSATEATSSTPVKVEAATAPPPTSLNWKELDEMLRSDPLLATAQLHETIADPFAPPQAVATDETTDEEQLEQPAALVQPKPTPEQLGLTLTSTITGGRRAVATINGQACRVGDVIVVPGGGMDFEFTVVSIAASEVALAAGDETHVLSSQRPASTMQLSQATVATGASLPQGGQRVVIGGRLGE
jgi:hypothetical protein